MEKRTLGMIGLGIVGVGGLGYFLLKNKSTGAATTSTTPSVYSNGTSIFASAAPTLSPDQQEATAKAAMPVAGMASNATGGIGGMDSPNGQGGWGNAQTFINQVGPGLAESQGAAGVAFYEPLATPSSQPTVLGV